MLGRLNPHVVLAAENTIGRIPCSNEKNRIKFFNTDPMPSTLELLCGNILPSLQWRPASPNSIAFLSNDPALNSA
jgi:hypothetical protein